MKARAFLLTLTLLCLALPALAFDPPPLEKVSAKRVLEFMEWREVTIISIRQGVDAKGGVAPLYATVYGLGKWKGEHSPICQTLYYDKDLDWHVLELGQKSARVWNKDGCQEIRPWGTW